jgi:hypothetical protein
VSLLWLPPAATRTFCEGLVITDRDSGVTRPWQLNGEQWEMLQAISTGRNVYAAKPRQVGVTTLVEADDILWCLINDSAGNRVRAGLYCDTEEKNKERVAFAASIIQQRPQTFAGCDLNSERLLFKNGSVLVFSTGSGKSEGRSGTFQRLHLSELPFWANPSTYGALMPSLGKHQCVIETTLDINAPNGIPARRLWRDKNSFDKVFFSVEKHAEYRAPANAITDEQWAFAQGEGFTDRESAAWWLSFALPTLVQGDMQRLMREFPQREGHMFAADESRFVKVTPTTATPLRTILVNNFAIEVYREPADCSGQFVLGVDVSSGRGGDACADALVDKKDRVMVACMRDNTIEEPDHVEVIARLYRDYTVHPPPMFVGADPPPSVSPQVVVEVQGYGHGLAQQLRRRGVPVTDQTISGDEGASIIYEALRRSRDAIAAGVLRGPVELATECDELRRDPVTGKWKGAKDLLVAYGHASRWCDINPYVPPAVRASKADVVDGSSMLASLMRPRSAWG